MCTSERRVARAWRLLSAGCLVGLWLPASACNRFPRDNPVDPNGSGALMVQVEDAGVAVSDLNSLVPANNENGVADAGETVLLTVPLQVMWASSGLTGAITAEMAPDASDEAQTCVLSVVAQGMVGNQLLVSFPAARSQPQPLLAGPVRVALASDCPPGTELPFVLQVSVTQNGELLELPFDVTVGEPGPGPTLTAVEVADPSGGSALAMGNGDGIIDTGESVLLAPTLENRTDALLPGMSLRVKSVGRECFNAVQVNGVAGAMMTFGNIVPGQLATSSDLLTAVVASDCSDGDDARLTFEANDAAGRTWEVSFVWVLGERGGAPVMADAGVAADDDDGG